MADILLRSRNNNARVGVTGMLVYRQKHFLQVLEGPKSAVLELYERIEGDPRHFRIAQLSSERIQQRSFGGWSMGYAEATPEFLAKIPGANDLFGTGECLSSISPGLAKRVLRAFRTGGFALASHQV
jgi:hypothetical protein